MPVFLRRIDTALKNIGQPKLPLNATLFSFGACRQINVPCMLVHQNGPRDVVDLLLQSVQMSCKHSDSVLT